MESISNYYKKQGASLYKCLFSGLAIYLSAVSGRDDIVIGGAGHNRLTAKQQQTVGMYASTIPFRVCLKEEPTFETFVKSNSISIDKVVKNHQRYPFDRLATEINERTGIDPTFLLDINLIGMFDMSVGAYLPRYYFSGTEPSALTIYLFYEKRRTGWCWNGFTRKRFLMMSRFEGCTGGW